MLRDDRQLANRVDLFNNELHSNVVVVFDIQNKTGRNCDVRTTYLTVLYNFKCHITAESFQTMTAVPGCSFR